MKKILLLLVLISLGAVCASASETESYDAFAGFDAPVLSDEDLAGIEGAAGNRPPVDSRSPSARAAQAAVRPLLKGIAIGAGAAAAVVTAIITRNPVAAVSAGAAVAGALLQ